MLLSMKSRAISVAGPTRRAAPQPRTSAPSRTHSSSRGRCWIRLTWPTWPSRCGGRWRIRSVSVPSSWTPARWGGVCGCPTTWRGTPKTLTSRAAKASAHGGTAGKWRWATTPGEGGGSGQRVGGKEGIRGSFAEFRDVVPLLHRLWVHYLRHISGGGQQPRDTSSPGGLRQGRGVLRPRKPSWSSVSDQLLAVKRSISGSDL